MHTGRIYYARIYSSSQRVKFSYIILLFFKYFSYIGILDVNKLHGELHYLFFGSHVSLSLSLDPAWLHPGYFFHAQI